MKKNIRSLFLLIVVTITITKSGAQQGALFSQYIFHGLYVNPAFAGYRGETNANLSFRNQWSGFPGAPKSLALAIEGPTHSDRVGLGFNVLSDGHGLMTSTGAYASYTYRFGLDANNKQKLAIGMSVGAIQDILDPSKGNFEDGDPVIIGSKKTLYLPDARLGILYHNDKYFLGVSVDNMLTHTFLKKKEDTNKFLDRQLHAYVTGGASYDLSSRLLLKPSFLIKDDLAGPTNLDLNAFLLIDRIVWIGTSLRSAMPAFYEKTYEGKKGFKPAALVGLAQVYIGNSMRVGYSYDYTLNSTELRKYATHEFTLGYYFGTKSKVVVANPRDLY